MKTWEDRAFFQTLISRYKKAANTSAKPATAEELEKFEKDKAGLIAMIGRDDLEGATVALESLLTASQDMDRRAEESFAKVRELNEARDDLFEFVKENDLFEQCFKNGHDIIIFSLTEGRDEFVKIYDDVVDLRS